MNMENEWMESINVNGRRMIVMFTCEWKIHELNRIYINVEDKWMKSMNENGRWLNQIDQWMEDELMKSMNVNGR